MNNSVITSFSKSDTDSYFLMGPKYFKCTSNPFNEKPMWIIKSLITNPGSYDPIIVMGTFTNYYYVMILDGDNESFLETAEFYTPEENIKY